MYTVPYEERLDSMPVGVDISIESYMYRKISGRMWRSMDGSHGEMTGWVLASAWDSSIETAVLF